MEPGLIASYLTMADVGFKTVKPLLRKQTVEQKNTIGGLQIASARLLDKFSDGKLVGVWNISKYSYSIIEAGEAVPQPWHVTGNLFVRYKEPRKKSGMVDCSLSTKMWKNRSARRFHNVFKKQSTGTSSYFMG